MIPGASELLGGHGAHGQARGVELRRIRKVSLGLFRILVPQFPSVFFLECPSDLVPYCPSEIVPSMQLCP
jgi:hypothetical protein